MGYFPVRYDSRVVNYERRGFIRLDTGHTGRKHSIEGEITCPLLNFASSPANLVLGLA